MYCLDCGAKVESWQEYCGRCGADLFRRKHSIASVNHTFFTRFFRNTR